MAEQVSTKPGDLNSDPRAQAKAGQEAAPAPAILAERGEKGDLQEPSGQLARHKQTWTRERETLLGTRQRGGPASGAVLADTRVLWRLLKCTQRTQESLSEWFVLW